MGHNVTISEVLCLMRFKCSKVNHFVAINQIRALLEGNEPGRSDGIMCNFYSSANEIEDPPYVFLKNNLGTKIEPVQNSALSKSNHTEFIMEHKRCFIFEVVIEKDEYISDLQYLLLLLHFLDMKHERYHVLISRGLSGGSRYSPLEEDDYFRISHQMYCYASQTAENALNRINQRISIYAKDSRAGRLSKNLCDNWRVAFPRTVQYGRIIPYIPITGESLSALLCNQNYGDIGYWKNLFQRLCKDYYDKIKKCEGDSSTTINIQSLIASDNYLEQLIFFATYYFIRVQTPRQEFMIKDIARLHEECMDITQGVFQLAENIVEHVAGKDGTLGCGILTMRIRDVKDAMNLYLKDQSKFPDVRYFMEIYITDLQYYEFSGIINKFVNNLKLRLNEINPDSKNFIISAAILLLQKEIRLDEVPCNNQIKEKILQYSKEKINDLSLESFFVSKKYKPLDDYLATANNIAFHYGLQILNNVINVREGYLFVRSGTGSINCFNTVNSSYYEKLDFPCYFGTAYVIYLPIKLKRNIEYIDVPGALQCDSSKEKYTIVEYPMGTVQISEQDKQSKERYVQVLSDSIVKAFHMKGGKNNKQIGVIRCGRLVEELGAERPRAYEHLAKALFLYFTSEEPVIENIALVDISQPYSVIKLFRQFALFFDRTGRNELIANQKSMFIVDNSGEIDVLFYGKDIISIKDSLFKGQLYGGSNDITLEIVEHLAGRKDDGKIN